jgi:predicted glycoside hydrolase/deacetylase ChbG (UPF0249 family)
MIIADDFGLDPAHDRVILDLLEIGALDGTSVMVRSDANQALCQELALARKRHHIHIGLHLNLTEELPSVPKIAGILPLWIKRKMRRIDPNIIDLSFRLQRQMFENQFGFMPDFIDGHQHCHAIAQNFKALKKVSVLAASEDFWVRSPAPINLGAAYQELRRAGLKTLLVMAWGYQLRRRLRSNNISTNSDFAGFMSYDQSPAFALSFYKLLSKRRQDCVIMVHPGTHISATEISGHPNALRTIEAEILENLKPPQEL